MTRLVIIAALCLAANGKPRLTDSPLEPMPMPETELPAGEVQDEPPSATLPDDIRPVVRVYTVPARLCRPCGEFKTWLRDNGDDAAFRFDVREAATFNDLPQWVLDFGVPLFHFDGSDGKSWVVRPGGWQGIAEVERQWQMKNPEPPRLQAAPASLAEQIRMFAGPGGTITIKPDRPVRATLSDGTVISYSALNAKYTFLAGPPSKVTITMDPPLPTASVKALGLVWVNATVQSLELRGDTLDVLTSRGRYSLSLEKVK